MKSGNMAANMFTILIVLGLVILGALGWARSELTARGPAVEPVALTVPSGARWPEVAEELEEKNAIRSAFLMRLAVRYSGRGQDLKAGEYEIEPGATVEEVVALLSTGGNVRYRITIPEGMTVAMAVERLKEKDTLTGEIEEMPPEGSLFPDTWEFHRGDTRASMIERMQEKMQRVLDEAWEERDPNTPLKSKEELLILASIVEKETRPHEHGTVASVFINRLRRGMKLQTDPTVIYGITEGKEPLGRGLKRSELNRRTPYNTYVISGLPPTPIANPGEASIRAAANPEDTDFLYFVADGSGGHAFARTLEEHNRNVAEWRRIERERKESE